jgi:hypothetical protein
LGPIHFGVFSHLRLAEDGQEDDPAAWCEPVGQADGVAVVAQDEP